MDSGVDGHHGELVLQQRLVDVDSEREKGIVPILGHADWEDNVKDVQKAS